MGNPKSGDFGFGYGELGNPKSGDFGYGYDELGNPKSGDFGFDGPRSSGLGFLRAALDSAESNQVLS